MNKKILIVGLGNIGFRHLESFMLRKNNYLIGSLKGNHLLRVKLNNKASKVLFVEKIYIGDSIRDLVYDNDSKTVFLALENSGSVGLLKKTIN